MLNHQLMKSYPKVHVFITKNSRVEDCHTSFAILPVKRRFLAGILGGKNVVTPPTVEVLQWSLGGLS
jgi:hypothetical protein